MTVSPLILIVDDEPFGREVLSALLHNQGYQLLFAADGAEALAKAAANQPDLILLDVMMTGMDGFEVCRRLRTDRTLAEVPIILVTALDDRESRLEGIAAGADDFVTKPFDRAELRLRVQTITRLNRYRRLLEERSRLSWVVEHSEDGYLLIDKNDIIHYANSRARLVLGIDERAIGDVTFLQSIGHTYRCEPQIAWEHWPAIDSQTDATVRYLVRPESSTAQVLWLQVDLIDSGDTELRLVRLRNVTNEMGIKHDTWTFHTSILHKLRTPLSGIIVSMNLITQRLSQQPDKMLGQMAEIALRGAKRLHEQIAEILSYIEVGRSDTVTGRYPVGAIPTLVAEVGELLEIEHVTVSLDPAAADHILVLPRQTLEMILVELFGNAKKFHPKYLPHIEVVIAPANETAVHIYVSDDGIVMSPEQMARVWQPYYQAEKFFTGEVSGMGLGLSMVAARLWSVGGSCRIANQSSGGGIIVSLHIPCATVAGPAGEQRIG